MMYGASRAEILHVLLSHESMGKHESMRTRHTW